MQNSKFQIPDSKRIFLLPLILLITACSSLVGSESTNSVGDFELSPENDVITFNSADGGAVYRSLSLSNTSSDTITLTDIVFYNNLCDDFSLYSITDADGNYLSGADFSDLAVVSGDAIKINVRYLPSFCSESGYQTTLYVYYQIGSSTYRTSVILEPLGSAVAPFACDEITDHSSEYDEATVNARPDDGSYFLRVDRMRGYMYVPASGGIVAPSDLALGTDVNGLLSEDFVTPFLEAEISGGDTISLSEFKDGADFCLPSPEGNSFFSDTYSLLTSPGQGGTIDEDGNILLEDVGVMLRAQGIPDDVTVIIADGDGVFQISIAADLTTGWLPTGMPETVSDVLFDGLEEASGQTDDDGDSLLPIEEWGGEYYLQGSLPENGRMTLVGVGTFTNADSTFIGASSAQTFLIDNEAYLFFVLDVTFMEEGTAE